MCAKLFGSRGKNARTEAPSRSQVNMNKIRQREHSRKPDQQYEVVEVCGTGRYLGLFTRDERRGWAVWSNQADETYAPTYGTYSYNSAAAAE